MVTRKGKLLPSVITHKGSPDPQTPPLRLPAITPILQKGKTRAQEGKGLGKPPVDLSAQSQGDPFMPRGLLPGQQRCQGLVGFEASWAGQPPWGAGEGAWRWSHFDQAPENQSDSLPVSYQAQTPPCPLGPAA